MSYPTWIGISLDLGIPNIVDPYTVYGNKPLHFDEGQPPCGAQINTFTQPLVGIDIPVLLEPTDKNGNVIVILGESPLRNDKAKISGNNVIFGTPFAIHQKMGCPSQCDVYKLIFDGLLSKGFSVYLTDIIKVWSKGINLNANINNNVTLFEKELDIIRNHPKKLIIVTWGNKASGAILGAKIKGIPSLHPGKQNWNNWKLSIFQKAVFQGNPAYATSRYPTPKSSTTADIVSKEALSEILQNIYP